MHTYESERSARQAVRRKAAADWLNQQRHSGPDLTRLLDIAPYGTEPNPTLPNKLGAVLNNIEAFIKWGCAAVTEAEHAETPWWYEFLADYCMEQASEARRIAATPNLHAMLAATAFGDLSARLALVLEHVDRHVARIENYLPFAVGRAKGHEPRP